MNEINKRIKGLIYNNCPEIIIETICFIFCIIVSMVILFIGYKTERLFLGYIISLVLLTIVSIVIHVHNKYIQKKNKNWRCFSCYFSLLRRGCVWINMDVKNKGKNENLKDVFLKELDALLKNDFIPKETVCYCVTHSLILDKIKEVYPDIKTEKLYLKNIARFRKHLLPKKECKKIKKDIRQFYAVKFIK